jgi:hypothetical protein
MRKELKVFSLGELLNDRANINFDLAIQRNYVWKEDTSSLLINSIFSGYSIGQITVMIDNDGVMHIIDGKQRLTTLGDFLDGKTRLNLDFPLVDGVNIASHKFEDLTQELKEKFLDSNVEVLEYYELTEIERDEVFRRLNNGIPLTAIEKTRALAQGEVVDFLNKVSATDFFTKKVSISDSAKNRQVHQEAILQVLALLLDKPTGFASKDLQTLALELKNDGITKKLQKQVLDTAKYLASAYTDNSAFLKKIHISSLFKVALKAQEQKISPEIFGEWTKNFFKQTKVGTTYATACGSGSARYENVVKRLREMEKYYDANIATTTLVPAEDTAKPVKNNQKAITKTSENKSSSKKTKTKNIKEDDEEEKDLIRKGKRTIRDIVKEAEEQNYLPKAPTPLDE